MHRLLVMFIAIVLASAMPSVLAQQGSAQAEKSLASGQHKATIDGDLKGAIEEYKKALGAAGNNRALAAQALLRMAECHQKLGEAEAQAIYQRLVRDYADQSEAVTLARARLTTETPATRVRGDRSVWSGPDTDGFGTISRDGRFLTYTDWKNEASLTLRDLVTSTDRRLTSGGSTQFSAISKDDKYVAYEWYDEATPRASRRYELRVARLNEKGLSDVRRLYDNEEVSSIAPFDWSSDGTQIAVAVNRKDGTRQIGLVATQDGSLRVLKSLDWKEPTKIFFSPDGKYIAYDLMTTDTKDERDVFVMAVDGSREAVVARSGQNIIMGWSPDGRHVLFASDRSGSFGLWGVAVEDGKAAGTPILLKPDVSAHWSVGLTDAGAMYVWKYASPIYVQTSAVDLASGRLLPNASSYQRFIGSRGRPEWSPDGKQLAFQSCNPLGGGPCALWIRSMETGQLREVKTTLGYFFFARWSPDGRELLTMGTDLRGRNRGLYRIDVQTGDTAMVAPLQATQPHWSADGKRVYFQRGSSLMARDLTTGIEREVALVPTANPTAIIVSPDEHHVAYQASESAGTQTLFVLPLEGGMPRAVFRATAPERLVGRFDWTAEGRSLVVARMRDDSGRNELWLVDVESGRTRKLEIAADHWLIMDGFRFDRAGKQVAFVAAAGQPGLEIRVLENFLPPRTKTASK